MLSFHDEICCFGENMLSLWRFSGKSVGQNRVLGEIFSEISPFDASIFEFIKIVGNVYNIVKIVIRNQTSKQV